MNYLNVRKNQKEFLEKVFTDADPLVEIGAQNSSGLKHWKLLVYDADAKNIISPLISLQRLRSLGVTLHLNLHSNREAVPEVPVVYLMKPSHENIMKLKSDCEKQLYDEIFLHFIEPATQETLEFLAKSMVEAGSAHVIKKVFDQFLGFVSLEPELFELAIPRSFSRYSHPQVEEKEIMKYMDEVSNGLVNVITTLRINPIIRCPKGGPAALLSQVLVRKLHSLFNNNDYQEAFLLNNSTAAESLEEIALSTKRPIIFIADRGVDLSSMVFHTSGYETLVDDLLGIKSNRVNIVENSESKAFTLDTETDEFWEKFKAKLIPEAVEKHSEELQRVSAQVSKIKQQTNITDDSEFSLLKTVESLPKLLEKKKLLEVHLEIIKATMSAVSDRKIYHFAELEEKMISRKFAELNQIATMIADPEKIFFDKVRLVAVYLLTCDVKKSDSEMIFGKTQEIFNALETKSVKDEEAFRFFKYVKKILSLKGDLNNLNTSLNDSSAKDSLWSLADKAAQGFMEAQKKVKGLVFSESLFPIVQMLHLVTRKREEENKVDEEFLYLDPKLGDKSVDNFHKIQQEITTGILFVVGGGSFAEQQNLKSYSDKNKNRRFIYGCTEMLNAQDFISQAASCFMD